MIVKNPMLDTDFLVQLLEASQREIFTRITALTINELPIEYIEGKATGGSVNVDGTSAVRRTCQLTMIAKEVNINDYYWGLNSKFKLEIGIANTINPIYPDIIWFNQGIFVITSFSTSQSINNFNINISGKDKMCLLNGDIAGALPHTTDFGVEENYNSVTGITTYRNIPIKEIIREAVQNFGNELARNIIINDIEDAGLELLEYRGDEPLYLFRENNFDQILNMTTNSRQSCYIFKDGAWTLTNVSDNQIIYDNLIELEGEIAATEIKLSLDSDKKYTLIKVEYGSIPGYRLTDLTFAGDLILNVGETITSLLDKIKNMLGEFEYFYDVNGKFIFQRKRNYVDIPWNALEANSEEIYVKAAINQDSPIYSFTGSNLITSFQNTPNLLNLRNDYAVWGTKKLTSGVELDIHMRYAIDSKPIEYKALRDNQIYRITDGWDWRELIYQMALDYRQYYHDDDFLYRVEEANPQFVSGITGYEQYYIDLEGFWRVLYNPNPESQYRSITQKESINIEKSQLYVNAFKPIDKNETTYDKAYVFIEETQGFYPFVDGGCALKEGQIYYYKTSAGIMNGGSSDKAILNQPSLKKEDLYLDYKGTKKFIDDAFNNYNKQLYILDKEYIENIEQVHSIYLKLPSKFIQYYIDKFGKIDRDIIVTQYQIDYFEQYKEYNHDDNTKNYWSTAVTDNPESLIFWFDFLEAEYSDLGKYSVPAVGARTKAINDKDVKSIYYREIPDVIFQSGEETYEHQTGYTYIQLQNTMENLFIINSKGKSAKERIEELLYNNSYCVESVNISTIPVYHLIPNNRILIRDDNSGINGEYMVSKITIPLTHNGTMNITATKAVSNIT